MSEVQTAIWLFENVIFGVDLSQCLVNSPPSASGSFWDAAGFPDHQSGHCFPGIGCDSADNITTASWGMTGKTTARGRGKYAISSAGGELWTVVSQDTKIPRRHRGHRSASKPCLLIASSPQNPG
jgi:hypothetical protein